MLILVGWLNGAHGSISLDRNATDIAAGVRVRLAHGDEIFVQLNGLVEPLPGLVQAVGAISKRDAIATTV